MNKKVKCFDVVKMVTDEATEQFAPIWNLNKAKEDVLKQYCSVIDKLAIDFDGNSFDVEVDEVTMAISITLECGDITITEKNDPFYELIKRTISVGFSVSDNEMLNVKFVFPSVWDRYDR